MRKLRTKCRGDNFGVVFLGGPQGGVAHMWVLGLSGLLALGVGTSTLSASVSLSAAGWFRGAWRLLHHLGCLDCLGGHRPLPGVLAEWAVSIVGWVGIIAVWTPPLGFWCGTRCWGMAASAVGAALVSAARIGPVTPRLAVVAEGASRVFAEWGCPMELVANDNAFTHQAVGFLLYSDGDSETACTGLLVVGVEGLDFCDIHACCFGCYGSLIVCSTVRAEL